ncbi:filamentous hemagglutinin N-terminal domain-containing protein [Bradyrhizobium sp. Ai1a-2]|uniref:two-partner secretion domain-containing protein n=1 Tax=Bradyrhizobium sp. Ai1a-2 TaxID=196490 RepID=UPI001363B00F|nr:filamentous hemagglutinin N-terminal domain-containing protein [Bradyrhizobium sp. Ai1a-2]
MGHSPVLARPLGAASPSPSAAAIAAAQSAQQQAERQAREASDALRRATLAIQALRASQQAARDAAQVSLQATPDIVPNGLRAGGLRIGRGVVDPGGNVNADLWQGANLPTESVDGGGRTKVNVDQTRPQAILSWDTFNVGSRTDLNFNQQGNRDWVALNRVLGVDGRPSQILGSIKADGSVYIINQNGIIFGGASQVNVGSLIASTAKISNDQFLAGLYSTQTGTRWNPSFTDAAALLGNGKGGGEIKVEADAQIETYTPASVTSGGGFILLMGGKVINAGSINTPLGQTVLSSGDDFVLRRGYSTEANNSSTTRGIEIAPVFDNGSVAGLVRNDGVVTSAQGDITLAGRTIEQNGILVASTSVNTRGTIHLLNSATDGLGSVTLNAGSVTMIIPDLESEETALNSQRDALIAASAQADGLRFDAASGPFNNRSILQDRLDQSRIEIVTGGNVVFRGGAEKGSLTIAQGGQVAVSAAGRVFAETGATIDVSGVRDVSLAMSSNNIVVNIQGNELRDSPDNRDNNYLKNQNVWVDIRNLVYVPSGTGGYEGDRYYTPGGLLEVGGYLANTAHTIGEWSAVGGTITLSGRDIVAQQGSVFDISGGSISYQGGYIRTTNFLGGDGRLYSIDNARGDMTFYGVGQGFSRDHERWGVTEVWSSPFGRGRENVRWEDGYTIGRDAGRLNLSTPAAIFEGEIVNDVVQGSRQNSARPDGVTDGYKVGQNVVAQNGTLSVGHYTHFGLVDAYSSDVRIGAIDQVAAALDADKALPDGRSGTVWFDAKHLSDQNLGGLSVATRGSVTVEQDFAVANGGRVALYSPEVNVNANIVARGGSVRISDGLVTDADQLVYLMADGQQSHVTVAAGATIDTRGLWVNGISNPNDQSGLAYLNGGSVAIDSTYGVTLERGSTIDVSSGGAITSNGKIKGGKGGSVTLLAVDQREVPSKGHGALTIDGDIRGYGFNGGGTLSIDAPSIVIGNAGTEHAANALLLTPDLFRRGFSKYDVNGHGHLVVADGTRLDVEVPVYRALAEGFVQSTADRPPFELWMPPTYLEDPTNGVMIQRAGADLVLESQQMGLGGEISVGGGSAIRVDPGRSITVQSGGQVTVDGLLRAPGGAINVIQLNAASKDRAVADPLPGQRSVWIGDHAVLDVSAKAVTGIDGRGRRYGVAPDGGVITIGAPTDRDTGSGEIANGAEAFVVVRPGAVLDASGTSAVIDLPARTGLGVGSTPLTLASNGGTIALNSLNGLYIDGTMRAFSGGAGASGGTLILTLDTARYRQAFGGSPIPDDVRFIRELSIGMDYQASGSDGPLQIGKGRISVEQIKNGGFDTFSALSDVIRFEGNVDLSMGRALEIYNGTFASVGSDGSVHLAAPYVALKATQVWSLEGNPVYPRATDSLMDRGWISTSRATLTIDAALIDINKLQSSGAKGTIPLLNGSRPYQYAGFDTVTLNSRGDIRMSGLVTGSRVLEVNGAQVYPVMAGGGSFAARDLVRFGRTTADIPEMPYSVFGKLSVASKTIEQGGILRAPLGAITLGTQFSGNDPTIPGTESVTLLDGGITSVSARGLVIPYGGTVDDITYTYNGNEVTAPIDFIDSVNQGINLRGKSFKVASGALLDLSGGGDLQGAGFISGRGGSVDVLTTPLVNANPGYSYSSKNNQVYAIVPGVQPGAAAIDATAGRAPAIGQQITIPGGIPGLPAGTYTLMPARYALQPGAYRVEVGGTMRSPLPNAVSVGNGTWTVSGYQSVANTGVQNASPTQLLVTPGTSVRHFSSYKETGYADFLLAEAARLGAPRPILPMDGKMLALTYPGETPANTSALIFRGKALFDPGGEGAFGGTVRVGGEGAFTPDIEIIPDGGPHTAGFVSIEADELNAIGATRMSLGGFQYFNAQQNYVLAGSRARSLVVRTGAVLEAPDILLSAGQGGVTIEDGVTISTIGKGGSVPFSAADGYSYVLYDSTTNVLALSNGLLDFRSLRSGSGAQGGITVGKAGLYTEGTLLFATSSAGKLVLDRDARYGARYLSLAVPTINIGENSNRCGGRCRRPAGRPGVQPANSRFAAAGQPGCRHPEDRDAYSLCRWVGEFLRLRQPRHDRSRNRKVEPV